jgi:hypothetical protein
MVIYTFLPNPARLVLNVNPKVELILITIFEKTKRETKKMGPLRFKTRLESSLLKLKASSNLGARVELQGSAKRFSNSATPANNLLSTNVTLVHATLTSHQCNHNC